MMATANFGVTRAARFELVDKLFIGSSMFRQGIDIDVVAADDETAYLLAYNGNQPVLELQELRRFFELGGRTNEVIVDMYAYSLAAMPKLSDTRVLLDDFDGRYVNRIWRAVATRCFDWTTYYQMRFQANNELLLTAPISFATINRRYKNGGNLGTRSGSPTERLMKLPMLPDCDVFQTSQANALIELVELCHAYGAQVTFVETPKYCRIFMGSESYVHAMENYLKLLDGCKCRLVMHDETLSRISSTPAAGVLAYSFDYSDAESYSDLIHLSSDGRKMFSATLKALLAQ